MTYPPPPPPGHVPPSQKRWWKATWALIGAGVLVGLVVGAASGASSAKTKTRTVTGPSVYYTETDTATATLTRSATVTARPVNVIATHTRIVTHTYTPPPVTAFEDGTYLIGSEVNAGRYHTDPAGSHCYWEADDSGGNIIDNNNIDGPTTITIHSSWYSITTDGGCSWERR